MASHENPISVIGAIIALALVKVAVSYLTTHRIIGPNMAPVALGGLNVPDPAITSALQHQIILSWAGCVDDFQIFHASPPSCEIQPRRLWSQGIGVAPIQWWRKSNLVSIRGLDFHNLAERSRAPIPAAITAPLKPVRIHEPSVIELIEQDHVSDTEPLRILDGDVGGIFEET